MKDWKRYRHIGVSYPGVPKGWQRIVGEVIIAIERLMWPRWIPMPVKQLIHWLGTGNSVVRVKFWWAYRLRQHLTGGQIVTTIKEKYATLRIYGSFGKEIDLLITDAEDRCSNTCQECGRGNDVRIYYDGWVRNLCTQCARDQPA